MTSKSNNLIYIKKEQERMKILEILFWIPIIKDIIKKSAELDGKDKWELIKPICERLWLDDTSFRDHPRTDGYLMDENYWLDRLKMTLVERGGTEKKHNK